MAAPVKPFEDSGIDSRTVRGQRLRRAWVTAAPPDSPTAAPSAWTGLVVGIVLAVALAGGTGVVSAVRNKTSKPGNAEVVALASVAPPADASSPDGAPAAAGAPVPDGTPTTLPAGVTAGDAAAAPASTLAGAPVGQGATGPIVPKAPSPTSRTMAPAPDPPVASPLDAGVTVRWPRLAGSTAAMVEASVVRPDGSNRVTRRVATAQGGVTFTGLVNGVQYRATVATVDGRGHASLPSPASAPVTPTTASPDPPPGVTGIRTYACNGCLTVVWPFPSGGKVTSYRVSLSPGGASAVMVWGVNGVTIANLDGGTTYTPSVVAVNGDGYSEPSPGPAATPATTGRGKPAAPTVVSVAKRSDGTYQATFTPGDNAGSPRASFTIVPMPYENATPATQTPQLDVTPGRPVTVTVDHLKPGRTYQFVVVNNSNGLGISEPSALSPPLRT